MKKKPLVCVIVCLLVIGTAGMVQGSLVRVDVTGTITVTDDIMGVLANAAINDGDNFSLVITYDTAATAYYTYDDPGSSFSEARYYNSYSMNIANTLYSVPGSGPYISIRNDYEHGSSTHDQFRQRGWQDTQLDGADWENFDLYLWWWDDNSTFSSSALPTASMVNALWQNSTNNQGEYETGDGDWAMTLNIQNVVATPIPSAFWLLGSALLGVVTIRKKLKK